jgi:hypothetical protein
MEEMIQEKIKQIPYQHKEELLNNLMWLARAGDQAVPALDEALSHDDPKVRASCAYVFGQMGDKRTIPILQRHRNDPHPVARLEIARSLLILGDYSTVPLIIQGLNSDMQHVRYLCYDILHSTTGKTFDYDHRAVDPVDREPAIAKWQGWWEKQTTESWFQQGAPMPRPEGLPARPPAEPPAQPPSQR